MRSLRRLERVDGRFLASSIDVPRVVSVQRTTAAAARFQGVEAVPRMQDALLDDLCDFMAGFPQLRQFREGQRTSAIGQWLFAFRSHLLEVLPCVSRHPIGHSPWCFCFFLLFSSLLFSRGVT